MAQGDVYIPTPKELDRNIRAVAWSGGTAMAIGALTALVIEASHEGPNSATPALQADHSAVSTCFGLAGEWLGLSDVPLESSPLALPNGGLAANALPLGLLD